MNLSVVPIDVDAFMVYALRFLLLIALSAVGVLIALVEEYFR